jgi:1-acyl-sn-glycerol-3-phosphate acyltransferase
MWPGTARVRFLEPIPPGLSGAEFSARLQQVVEAESTAMILEAVAGGIARPITPAFRERIAAAQANGPHSP